MLFVAQHVVRKGTAMHPLKWGMNLFSLLTLDILYMMLLRIAAGQKWEDLLDEWVENPFMVSMKYGVRLPVLGRIFAILGDGLISLVDPSPMHGMRGGISMIPSAAALTIARDVKKGVSSLYGLGKNLVTGDRTEDVYGQDFLNVMKHTPFLGESWARQLGYYFADHVTAPEFAQPVTNWFKSNMDLRRSYGSGGGGGGFHHGIPAFAAGFTYEAIAHRMGREMYPNFKMTIPNPVSKHSQFNADAVEQPSIAPPPPPPELSAPVDPVEAIVDMEAPEVPQELLEID